MIFNPEKEADYFSEEPFLLKSRQQDLFLQGRDAMISIGLQGDLDIGEDASFKSQERSKCYLMGSINNLCNNKNDEVVTEENIQKGHQSGDEQETNKKKNQNNSICEDKEIVVDLRSFTVLEESEKSYQKEENEEELENIQNISKETSKNQDQTIIENKNSSNMIYTQKQNEETIKKVKLLPALDRGVQIILKLIANSENKERRINVKVKQIIHMMQRRSINRPYDNLKGEEYQLINDKSHIIQSSNKRKHSSILKNNRISNTLSVILKTAEKILLKIDKDDELNEIVIPIFQPTSLLRVTWDGFIIMIIYILMFWQSLLVFFGQQSIQEFQRQYITFLAFCFCIFIMDLLISLNTAFFDQDTLVDNRKKIAKQFLSSKLFIFDSICIIFLLIKVIDFNGLSKMYNPDHSIPLYLFNCLIFLKGFYLSRYHQRFHYVFTLKENQRHLFSLCKQLFNLVTVAHIGNYFLQFHQSVVTFFAASILWHLLGILEERNHYHINWIQAKNLSNATYIEHYIYSFYWSITTMTTVGYGDIAATNSTEAVFMSIMLLVFSCVFAYSINNIGIILQEIQKSSKELQDNITTIQRYLNRKRVPIELKSRVRHYLEFLAAESQDRDKSQEDQILNKLSNKLRDEIKYEINSKIINNCALFTTNFSSSTLKQLASVLEELVVSPNEVIFRQNQIDDASFYMIQSGVIEIFSQLNQFSKVIPIQSLASGQSFGEMAFFSGIYRTASARSVNLSTLYRIKRQDFLSILSKSEDFERFKMISEKILVLKDFKSLYVLCYTCKQYGHMAQNCWKTHQEFDKQLIILKNNFSSFQDRSSQSNQRRRQKNNSLKLLIDLKETLLPSLRAQLQEIFFSTIKNLIGNEECSQLQSIETDQSDSREENNSNDNEDEESKWNIDQTLTKQQNPYDESNKNDNNKEEDDDDDDDDSDQDSDEDGYENSCCKEEKNRCEEKEKNQQLNGSNYDPRGDSESRKDNKHNNKQEFIQMDTNQSNSYRIIMQQSSSIKKVISSLKNGLISPSNSEKNIKFDYFVEDKPNEDIFNSLNIKSANCSTYKSENQNVQQIHLSKKNEPVSNCNHSTITHAKNIILTKEQNYVQQQPTPENHKKVSQSFYQQTGKQNSWTSHSYNKQGSNKQNPSINKQDTLNNTVNSDASQQETQNQKTMTLGNDQYYKRKKESSHKYTKCTSKYNKQATIMQLIQKKIDHKEAEEVWKLCQSHAQDLADIENKGENKESIKKKLLIQQKLIQMGLSAADIIFLQNSVQKDQVKSNAAFHKTHFHKHNTLQSEEMFESMKKYNMFFVHNNYDKVLNNLKLSIAADRKAKKSQIRNRRQNFIFSKAPYRLSFTSLNQKPINQQPYDSLLYAPTFLSYGISKRDNTIFPLFYHQFNYHTKE